jgi:hypothetical protein
MDPALTLPETVRMVVVGGGVRPDRPAKGVTVRVDGTVHPATPQFQPFRDPKGTIMRG